MYLAGLSEEKDPSSFAEILKSEDEYHWLTAISEELESLKENYTWELVDSPKHINVLKT